MSFCSWFGGEKFRDHFEKGVYACANCGTELFHSSKKYEHHTPWPAFYDTVTPNCLSKFEESHNALKVSCAKCGNGLGHEFLGDGPKKGQSRF
ncbi:Methionine-R-sulfoxide reductase B1-A [Mactra antiquata]